MYGYDDDDVGRKRRLGRAFKRFARATIPGVSAIHAIRHVRAQRHHAQARHGERFYSPGTAVRTPAQTVAARGQGLGFPVTNLAIGGSGQAIARVLKPFKPGRMVLSATGGNGLDDLVVTNIRVNTESQLSGNQGLPGQMFARDTTTAALSWLASEIGGEVTLDFTNIGAAALVVAAGIYAE